MLFANHIICGQKLTTRLFCRKICLTRANYYYRQYFFENKKKLSFNQLYHKVSKSDDDQALPTKVSQQIIRRLDSAWSSYFSALREWKKQPNKFLGKPKIPKYKHKTMHVEIFCPIQMNQFRRKALKKGICHLSMSQIKYPLHRQK